MFGSLLTRELGARAVPMTRRELDLRDVDAVARVARDAFAICCTAGPFQGLDRRIVRACVDAGAHWLDIADDQRWFFDLLDDRELDVLARERGVAVLPGLSSLPAISGALARRLMPVESPLKITLIIHNRNRKGAAAIASAAQSFHPPDRELLRRELGVEAEAFVTFELPGVKMLLRLMSALPERARMRAAKLASALASPFRFGRSGGAVEVRDGDRVARAEGRDQRFAILPVVYALDHLDGITGCHAPSVFDQEELLGCLR